MLLDHIIQGKASSL